jgi:phage gp29-like protein
MVEKPIIYDAYGRVIQTPGSTKPETREITVANMIDRYSTYPSEGLTPQRLSMIFKEANEGNTLRQAELFEEMEEKDTHLFSVLGTRKLAITGTEYEITPATKDKNDIRNADFVRETLNDLEGFSDANMDVMDALGKGFSGTEIMWDIQNREVRPIELRYHSQKLFTFGHFADFRKFHILTEENPALGEPLTPNKFIVHLYKAKSGHPGRAGLLRVCAWMYLFKNYALKDWVSFAELFGMPIRIGKYDPSASEKDKNALLQALLSLASDAAGIISTSTTIEFIESQKATSAAIFENLAKFCDLGTSKAVLGQTLTTEVGSHGSYAASKTHGDVRQDLKEADCKALAATFRRDLIRPLVIFNYGSDAKIPIMKFHYEPPEDLKDEADTYKVLSEAGLRIPARHVYNRFSIPEPAADEPIMQPPSATVPAQIPMSAAGIFPGMYPYRLNELYTARPTVHDLNVGVDGLADKTLALGVPILDADVLQPLRDLINRASSFEEILKELPALYPELDTSNMEELIMKSLFNANLAGRCGERV